MKKILSLMSVLCIGFATTSTVVSCNQVKQIISDNIQYSDAKIDDFEKLVNRFDSIKNQFIKALMIKQLQLGISEQEFNKIKTKDDLVNNEIFRMKLIDLFSSNSRVWGFLDIHKSFDYKSFNIVVKKINLKEKKCNFEGTINFINSKKIIDFKGKITSEIFNPVEVINDDTEKNIFAQANANSGISNRDGFMMGLEMIGKKDESNQHWLENQRTSVIDLKIKSIDYLMGHLKAMNIIARSINPNDKNFEIDSIQQLTQNGESKNVFVSEDKRELIFDKDLFKGFAGSTIVSMFNIYWVNDESSKLLVTGSYLINNYLY